MELAWRSGSVMDCYTMAQCKNWASCPCQGTVNGGCHLWMTSLSMGRKTLPTNQFGLNPHTDCIQWNPSCQATPFSPEKWPFKRGGLSSEVEINTFMFRFTLSSGLSRGGGLTSGWPLKRGSTVHTQSPQQPHTFTQNLNSYCNQSWCITSKTKNTTLEQSS